MLSPRVTASSAVPAPTTPPADHEDVELALGGHRRDRGVARVRAQRRGGPCRERAHAGIVPGWRATFATPCESSRCENSTAAVAGRHRFPGRRPPRRSRRAVADRRSRRLAPSAQPAIVLLGNSDPEPPVPQPEPGARAAAHGQPGHGRRPALAQHGLAERGGRRRPDRRSRPLRLRPHVRRPAPARPQTPTSRSVTRRCRSRCRASRWRATRSSPHPHRSRPGSRAWASTPAPPLPTTPSTRASRG